MRIRLQLFAAVRDLAGGGRTLEVDLPAGSKVNDLRCQLGRERPALQRLLDRCAIAIDEEFVGDDVILEEGQRIALLPPVSGGQ